MSEKYNGWTNYETWLVGLWLDSSESSQHYWTNLASHVLRKAKADKSFTKEERGTLDLMKVLKDEIEEANPLSDANVYTDLLTGALSDVNWYEVAGHFIDAVKPEEESVAN